MAMTHRPYPTPAGDSCSAEAQRGSGLGKRAGDHEKDGRGTQRTVRSSRSTRRSDCFLYLAPRILEARRALSRQGNRTSLGNLISPRESPDDTDLWGLLRKWPGQVTHSEGQSPCCTHCANEQSATD